MQKHKYCPQFLIQSKLHPTITAKTQHSQNSVGAETFHPFKDNLFG